MGRCKEGVGEKNSLQTWNWKSLIKVVVVGCKEAIRGEERNDF